MPYCSPQHHMKCQITRTVGRGGGGLLFFPFSFDVYCIQGCVRTQVSSTRTKLVLDLCKGEGEGAGWAGGGREGYNDRA